MVALPPIKFRLHIMIGDKSSITRTIRLQNWFCGENLQQSKPFVYGYKTDIELHLLSIAEMFHKQHRISNDDFQLIRDKTFKQAYQLDYMCPDEKFRFFCLDDDVLLYLYQQIFHGYNPHKVHHFVVWFPSYHIDLTLPNGHYLVPAFILDTHPLFRMHMTPMTDRKSVV